MKVVGGIELIAWFLLWTRESAFGALILTILMGFAIHMHMTVLDDEPADLALQFVLLASSLAVCILSLMGPAEESDEEEKGKKKD